MPDAFSYCAELVRKADRDRFIGSLFAPPQHRNALYALYAFNTEVARVRDLAREVMPGEIRLQWWREVLQGERGGEARASPVAAAVLYTAEKYRLPIDEMLELIEARRFDLYSEPMLTIAQLENYAVKTSSAVIKMAAQILGTDVSAAARPAGVASTITSFLAALPNHTARGQLFLPLQLLERHGLTPEDVLARVRSVSLNAAVAELCNRARDQLDAAVAMLDALPREALPAFLYLAPMRQWLDRLERSDVFTGATLSPLRRQWLIWRAARRPDRLAK
jgi:phytoene synthase